MNILGSRSQIHLPFLHDLLFHARPAFVALPADLCPHTRTVMFLIYFLFPRLDEQKKIMIMICCVILAIILASTIGGIFA